MLIPILFALTGVSLSTILNASSRDDCTASEPGIRMTVSGLRDQRGSLTLELYPANENDFLAKVR